MSPPKRSERGFILISAVWLLVLCGAIAAVMMLRSIAAARETRSAGEELQRKALMEGAVETVFANILFGNSRSPRATAPSSAPIPIGGRAVQVSLTNEAGRIDLNEYPLAKLSEVLQGLGVEAEDRQRILAALKERREAGRPLTSGEEMRALFAGVALEGAEAAEGGCLEQEFTIFTGLPAPRESQVSDRLAKAIGLARAGQAGTGPNAEPVGAGTPLRAEARFGSGPPLTAVARLTGLNERPVAASSWGQAPPCRG